MWLQLHITYDCVAMYGAPWCGVGCAWEGSQAMPQRILPSWSMMLASKLTAHYLQRILQCYMGLGCSIGA